MDGHDLKDPQLSPIYGDFTGFPPVILNERSARSCLEQDRANPPQASRAGVEAEVQVYEGMSNARYNFDPYASKTKEAFTGTARFFDKRLGKQDLFMSAASSRRVGL